MSVATHLDSVLKRDLEFTLSKKMPVVVLTDSLSLFNVMIRTSTVTTEERLMI